MRRRLISMVIAAAVIAAAVMAEVATRDGADGADSAVSSPFARRTAETGEVTVEATLVRLDVDGATVQVVFDTHTEELGLDVAAGATFTVGGAPFHAGMDRRRSRRPPPRGRAALRPSRTRRRRRHSDHRRTRRARHVSLAGPAGMTTRHGSEAGR